MRVEILIVTYAADRWWLSLCLQSIRKHTTGFARVAVVYPRKDDDALCELCWRYEADAMPVEEPAGKGHLAQNLAKCRADIYCPSADYVLHADSDCVFTVPVTPDHYFRDGLPILWRRSYAGLFAQTSGAWLAAFRLWQQNVQRALGWAEQWETMARLPIVHCRETYAATRDRIERVHGMPFDRYVLSQPCEMTATGERRVQPHFVEFNTLGSIALQTMSDRYAIETIPDDVNRQGLPAPWPGAEPWALEPRPRMRQFMSHDLRRPGGVGAATLAELRSYGLEP